MARKSTRKGKQHQRHNHADNVVFYMSAEEATLARKPHYNGFAGGYGAHGDAKYNRCRERRAWKREMDKGW